MFAYLRSLLRVTAVRLSIIYTLIFGVLAVGIVAYMTGATVNVLRQQYEDSINEEVTQLAAVYNRRGLRTLVRVIDRRARAPGANLYVVTNPAGEIIAGNVPRLESRVLNKVGWTRRPFRYYGFEEVASDDDRDGDEARRALARVLELPNGMRILVGRDIGDTEEFRHVVARAFNLAIGTMLLLGILTWFFVGRRALKRIDDVSKSSQRILAGDRTERLPISGGGDEFDRLSVSLNTMLDRIGRLDDGLKQMSDNIAHDLKTPITRLRNKAEQALAEAAASDKAGKASEGNAHLEEIIGDCDQIVKTFDALLMISRVESGASVARRTRLNVASLMADLHELYEVVAEDDGVTLILEPVDEGLSIYGNRELLSQALTNLIDNALKYGKPVQGEGAISLSAKTEGDMIRLSVADNGNGIPEAEQARVTERFVRLDKSRNLQGNGLGLSLARAVAEMHEGNIELTDNAPGLRVSLVLSAEGR